MNDFLYQKQYVRDQARRMMSMQDMHPASPSYGCFHYSYWRDKTSEFPDSRFQEAGATLGLLSHPAVYSQLFPAGEISQATLRARFSASLNAWSAFQHKDGSWDEWYKHEHGFAVTTFSLLALGMCVHFLKDDLDSGDLDRFKKTADRAARWLLSREDLVKTNHEMAGAAALAVAGKILGKAEYLAGAKKKLVLALDCQTEEGWFNEIAGMDLGYCFVLLDYAMLYGYFSGDESAIPAMKKLYRFVFPFVQPNLTISPEAGICLNPYVSRVGTLLLAEHSPEAAAIALAMSKKTAGYDGIEPYLADDLRLCRWSHLPIVADLLIHEKKIDFSKFSQIADLSTRWTINKTQAGVISYRTEKQSAVFLPAGGGVVRIVSNVNLDDQGYIYHHEGTLLSTVGYDSKPCLTTEADGSYLLKLSFAPASFFFPSFLARLGLRILGGIPGLHVWLRKGIDLYRKINKTAINQSAAPVSNKETALKGERRVRFQENEVMIKDTLRGVGLSQLAFSAIQPVVSVDQTLQTRAQVFAGQELPNASFYVITKRFRPGDACWQVTVTAGS